MPAGQQNVTYSKSEQITEGELESMTAKIKPCQSVKEVFQKEEQEHRERKQ